MDTMTHSNRGKSTLPDYLQTAQHKGFTPGPRYYPVGDYLTFFAKEDRCESVRVNELLTIYVSTNDRSLVGCKIKSVSQVIRRAVTISVTVADEKIRLGILLLSVAAITEDAQSRQKVLHAARQLPTDVEIPLDLHMTAA